MAVLVPPLATLLAASVALFLAPAQAGNICCAPRQYSVYGTSFAKNFLTNQETSASIARNYDADAQKLSNVVRNQQAILRSVQVQNIMYLQVGGQCRSSVSPFVEECLSDEAQLYHESAGNGEGSGGGGGGGDSDQLKTYVLTKLYKNDGVWYSVTTIWRITLDCMLKEKTQMTKTLQGHAVSLYHWAYNFQSVGSLSGNPAAIFAHCTP